MSSINSGDKFLVNRSNTSYQLEAENAMAEIQDNDLMLVNRGGTSYKISGADIKSSLDPQRAPSISSVTLAEDNPGGDRFSGETFTATTSMSSDGIPAAQKSIRVNLAAQLYSRPRTDEIIEISNNPNVWTSPGPLYANNPEPQNNIRADMFNGGREIVYQKDLDRYVRFTPSQYGTNRIDGGIQYSDDGVNWTDSVRIGTLNPYYREPLKWIAGRPDGSWVITVSTLSSFSTEQYMACYSTDNGVSWTASQWNVNSYDNERGGAVWWNQQAQEWWVYCYNYANNWSNAYGIIFYSYNDGSNFISKGIYPGAGNGNNRYAVTYAQDLVTDDTSETIVVVGPLRGEGYQLTVSQDYGNNWFSFKATDIGLGGSWSPNKIATDNNGTWVIASTQGLVISSDNGTTWEKAIIQSVSDKYTSVVYSNGLFIAPPNATWNEIDLYDEPTFFYTTASDIKNWKKGYVEEDLRRLKWSQSAFAGPVFGVDSLILQSGDLLTGAPGERYPYGYIVSAANGLDTVELTFASAQDLSLFKGGDNIYQDDSQASAVTASVNESQNKMELIEVEGAFTKNQGNYVVGPATESIVSDTLYCNLDSQLKVKDFTLTPPNFVPFDGNTANIIFPEIMPDGQPPDATLLPGTQVSATVQADNLSFSPVTKTSNTVIPNATRSPSFDDTDPAQLAEFNAAKDSLETYETERDARRQTLKSQMLAANFTDADIAAAGLDDA